MLSGRSPTHRLLGVLLLASALVAAALTGSAAASRGMVVGIADDGVTQRQPSLTAATVPRWKAAGVDVARVLVIWHYVAPVPGATNAPAGFQPSNPDDPNYDWGPIDNAINALRANGIEPIVAVTGPGPVWGSRVPSRRNGRYKPDPAKFASFAGAVAKRYGATVGQYIVWNEPNQPVWLQPQFSCVHRHCTPASPAIYRAIYQQVASAIKRADHGARVYAGALAPRGHRPRAVNAVMKPLTFLRALGCVDRKLKAERRSATCRRGFHPIAADGIAYHPHGILSSPLAKRTDPDEASMADIPRLLRTIDRIQYARGMRNGTSYRRPLGLYFTEYGYQTNPPDPVLGVSLSQQAAWIQEGAYLAWRQPRVRMLIQYLWRDDPLNRSTTAASSFTGWQSGLFDEQGHAKPAARVFPNPFWVDLPRGRRTATVWGQVRPGGRTTVTVQRRLHGRVAYTTLKRIATDARGYFTFHTTVRVRTSYRFRYQLDDGGPEPRTVTSSAVTVAPQ